MRVFLISAVCAVVVAIGAMYALNGTQMRADQAFTTGGARVTLTDANNLVGKDWYPSKKF